MRSLLLALVLAAGCSFAVRGADPAAQGPSSGGIDPPPSVTSDLPDAALPGDDPGVAPDMARTTPPTPPGPQPPPDMAGAPKAIGDPCAKNSDCGPNRICLLRVGLTSDGNFPGGYCTVGCLGSACPAGSVCQLLAGSPLCVAQCPPTQCRQSYRCCGPQNNECLPTNLCD